jgi:1,4-dihydroxy-2-naphthoate octaprenyltransferase
LPLSISGILTGGAIVLPEGPFNLLSFSLCLVITLLFQIISNLANDLGDGIRGTDNERRVGPARALQSGLLTAGELNTAITGLSLLSMALVVILLFHAFGAGNWPLILLFLVMGGLSIWAGKNYTMGKNPYGYYGGGDLAVFLFFGLLAVVGTQFVVSMKVDFYSLLPASAIGLLSTAVLNLNNMRDVENDALQGKRTLVVKMGSGPARFYHMALLLLSLTAWLAYLVLTNQPGVTYWLLWPYVIIFVHLNRVFRVQIARDLDPELKKVALSTFFISLTLLILKLAFY